MGSAGVPDALARRTPLFLLPPELPLARDLQDQRGPPRLAARSGDGADSAAFGEADSLFQPLPLAAEPLEAAALALFGAGLAKQEPEGIQKGGLAEQAFSATGEAQGEQEARDRAADGLTPEFPGVGAWSGVLHPLAEGHLRLPELQKQPLLQHRVGNLGGLLGKGGGPGNRPETAIEIREAFRLLQRVAVGLELVFTCADHPLAGVAGRIHADPGEEHLHRSDQQKARGRQRRQSPPDLEPLAQQGVPRLQHAREVEQHQSDQNPAAIGHQIGQRPELPLVVGEPEGKQGQHHGGHPSQQEGGGSCAGQVGQAVGLGQGDAALFRGCRSCRA